MKTSLVSAMLTAALLLGPATGWSQTSKSEGFVTVQPAGQWLVSQFIGQTSDESTPASNVGDINDVLFDKSGQHLDGGDWSGRLPRNRREERRQCHSARSRFTADADGQARPRACRSRRSVSRQRLSFKPTEKTVYMRAKEQAAEMGQKAIDTAKELKDKAAKTIDSGMKSEPKNN